MNLLTCVSAERLKNFTQRPWESIYTVHFPEVHFHVETCSNLTHIHVMLQEQAVVYRTMLEVIVQYLREKGVTTTPSTNSTPQETQRPSSALKTRLDLAHFRFTVLVQ